MVGRAVLRDELDLLQLRVGGEQSSADLVDQVLDRATVESWKMRSISRYRSRTEKAGASATPPSVADASTSIRLVSGDR